MNFRKILQFAALGLMLIIFPLGSWYYLRMGYNERKGALDQLTYEIPLNDFNLVDQNGATIARKDLQGGFAVIGNVKTFSVDDPVIQASEGLFEEFASSKKMALLTYVEEFDRVAIDEYLSSLESDSLRSEWHFIQGVNPFGNVFENGQTNKLALVDTFGVVRNYYDATNNLEIQDMAKHIAMFVMPLMKDAELVFRRKEEK